MSKRGTSKSGGVAVLLAMLCYIALLQFVYRELVAPLEGYQGFVYRDPQPFAYLTSIVLVLVVAWIMPNRITVVSDFILWVLFVTAGASSILISQYADVLSPSDATLLGFHVALCMVLLRVVVLARPRMGLERAWVGAERLFLPAVLALVALAMMYLAIAGLLSSRVLSFKDVYSVREQVGLQTQGDVVAGYLLPTVHKVLGPLLLGIGIFRRQTWLVLAGVATQLIMYASLGSKTIVISVVAVWLVSVLFKQESAPRTVRFLGGATVSLAAMVAIDLMRDSASLTFFGVRRLEVVPGLLTSAYVSTFQNMPKVHFADSLLFFLDSPYARSPALIVGDYFLGNERSNASVNLWGDGYANFGYLGMYMATMILAVLLWVADDVSRGLPMPVACAVMLMPTAAVGEAGVFTLMFSHGFIPALFVCALLPRSWFQRDVHQLGEQGTVDHSGHQVGSLASNS